MKPATMVTTVLLIAIAVLHLARMLAGVEVTAGGVAIPMWASGMATIIPFALAYGVWREHRPPAGNAG